jgi:5-methylthioribose kinase
MEKLLSVSSQERKYELCMRIETAARSFIIKQSRGYVEKYPQIAAPASVLTEGAFMKIASSKSAAVMPCS